MEWKPFHQLTGTQKFEAIAIARRESVPVPDIQDAGLSSTGEVKIVRKLSSISKDDTTAVDKNGRAIEVRDYEARKGVGVQIGHTGHKLWVCIDGVAVLRVKSPMLELTDMREDTNIQRLKTALQQAVQAITAGTQSTDKRGKVYTQQFGEAFVSHLNKVLKENS